VGVDVGLDLWTSIWWFNINYWKFIQLGNYMRNLNLTVNKTLYEREIMKAFL
jgi:hypothetical protein